MTRTINTIKISDVKSALGSTSNNIASLVASSAINQYSKYKPVVSAKTSALTDAELSATSVNFGMKVATSSVLLQNTYSSSYSISYNRPTSNLRLSDFIGYSVDALPLMASATGSGALNFRAMPVTAETTNPPYYCNVEIPANTLRDGDVPLSAYWGGQTNYKPALLFWSGDTQTSFVISTVVTNNVKTIYLPANARPTTNTTYYVYLVASVNTFGTSRTINGQTITVAERLVDLGESYAITMRPLWCFTGQYTVADDYSVSCSARIMVPDRRAVVIFNIETATAQSYTANWYILLSSDGAPASAQSYTVKSMSTLRGTTALSNSTYTAQPSSYVSLSATQISAINAGTLKATYYATCVVGAKNYSFSGRCAIMGASNT